jgi:hypothetical protein
MGLRLIAFANGYHITSDDNGVTWASTSNNISVPYTRVSSSNKIIIVTFDSGSNTYFYSNDFGSTWNWGYFPTVAGNGRNIVCNGTTFLELDPAGYILTSTDGIIWSGNNNPLNVTANYAAWNGNIWVAVSDGNMMYVTSLDGITWTERSFNLGISGSQQGIIWNGNVFCIPFIANGNYNTHALISQDGIVWSFVLLPTTDHNMGTTNALIAVSLSAILIIPGSDQAVTNFCISDDNGVTWSAVNAPISSKWSDITWNNDVFCIVPEGITNTVYTSSNGVIWTPQTLPITDIFTVINSLAVPVFPVIKRSPIISGNTSIGSVLTVTDNGVWESNPTSFSYLWYQNSYPIFGEELNTLTILDVYSDQVIYCQVTAYNSEGQSFANSNTLGIPQLVYTLPSLTGIPAPGNTLSLNIGYWQNGEGSVFSCIWHGITGPTTQNVSSYDVLASDAGASIYVTVIGTDRAGSTSADSNTMNIPGISPVNRQKPVVTGNIQLGQTLTTSNGVWINNPILFTYQWQQHGINIAIGTNSPTYITQLADIGFFIECVVTAENASGGIFLTSNKVGPIIEVPPVNIVPPLISGNLVIGQTLTLDNIGVWDNVTTNTTYTYQWQRWGYINIAGASGTTPDGIVYYTVQESDLGFSLSCLITATNSVVNASVSSNSTSTLMPSNPLTLDGSWQLNGKYYLTGVKPNLAEITSVVGLTVAESNTPFLTLAEAQNRINSEIADIITTDANATVSGNVVAFGSITRTYFIREA